MVVSSVVFIANLKFGNVPSPVSCSVPYFTVIITTAEEDGMVSTAPWRELGENDDFL